MDSEVSEDNNYRDPFIKTNEETHFIKETAMPETNHCNEDKKVFSINERKGQMV